MEDQIPDVVELSIRGRTHITLLSILTKDEDSVLAAMFTGRLPVHKDKDNRYFIDANPDSFELILHFLRDDHLPEYGEVRGTGFGFGGGGGLFGGAGRGNRGVHNHPYFESEIRALYKEAKYFGIKELVKKLENYRPVLMERRLEEYRKSKKSYDECLSKILEAITGEEILYGMNLTVQLRQESHTIEESKCCEHQCIDDSNRSFGQVQTAWETDVVVTIPPHLDVALFKMLFTDLQNIGYNVQGRLAVCHFRCNKKSKKAGMGFGGFGFHPDIFCCMEKLYLLQFTLASSPSDNLGQFQKQGAMFFGQQAAGFGAKATSSFGQGSLFGGKHEQNSLFQSGHTFGSAQNHQQQQQQQQQQQNSSGITFGSAPTQQQHQQQGSTSGFSFGSAPSFGSLNPHQNNSTSGFGQAPGFAQMQNKSGVQQPTVGTSPFGASSQLATAGLFGSPGGSSSCFGTASATTTQPTGQQGSVFGSKFASGLSFGKSDIVTGKVGGEGFETSPSSGFSFGKPSTSTVKTEGES